jgi:Flp pilus assembly protein TadG
MTDSHGHRSLERGSAAIEAVIAVPACGFLIGLIVFGGRVAVAEQAVQTAASDAARAASISRDMGTVQTTAADAATVSLTNQDLNCADVSVSIDAQGFQAAVGQDAQVTVNVACRLALDDLVVPGVPGSVTVEAAMSSPLDTWRERS